MFKIYFPSGTHCEIPLSVATGSTLIKNLIEDTNTDSFTIPFTSKLTEEDITDFFYYYPSLLKDNLTPDTLLTCLYIADYFAYEDVSGINLITELTYRIVHALIKEKSPPNSDYIRIKYQNLPPPLKDQILKAIRSPRVTILSLRQETSDDCIKRMLSVNAVFSKKAPQSIKVADYGKLQIIKLNGILTDDYPPKSLYILNDCRSTPYNPDVHQINEIYILSDFPLNNPTLWPSMPISNNYTQELVPIPEINLENGSKRMIEVSGFPCGMKWFSYRDNNLYFNSLMRRGSQIIISLEGKDLKEEIMLDSPLLKLSATKYNTYVFGKTCILKGSLTEKYKSMIPWQIEDQEDDTFYSMSRTYDVIIVIDLLTNIEVFKMIIPSNELCFIENQGKHLIFVSSSRKTVELYHIGKKVRLLKINFKDIFEDLTGSEFILNTFDKLIIINTSSYPITISFQGKIVKHTSYESLRGKVMAIVKNGILTLLDNGIICLRDPSTFNICHKFNISFRTISPYILRQKILVSPKGENFSLFHHRFYHFRLSPIIKSEYQSLEYILEPPLNE